VNTLLIVGAVFLSGLAADVAGRLTPLPRVTLLLLAGVLVGPSVFALIPSGFIDQWFPTLTHMALAMVGFLMGHQLSVAELRKRGKVVSLLALGKVVGAALVVFVAVWALTGDLALALVLGGVATATAPAATFDVVHEAHARGAFADNLVSIVAIDDAWGLVLFSVLLALAASMANGDALDASIVGAGVMEVLGSLVLGVVIGVPMAYLTGRLTFGERQGEPIQAESFGFVLACAGGAVLLDLSPILASMAMGSVVASLARHHARPFHAIEGVEWPFMILFFVLAGASLEVEGVSLVGWLALAYLVARALGTHLGIYLTAGIIGTDGPTRRWMGLALMPQAGVALGMALIASQRLPGHAETILTLVLSTTILLELVSPIITRRILERVGAGGELPDATDTTN
jgi:Kef-type K+ transport system membrane component KefB